MGRGVVEEARNRRENSVRRLNPIACCSVSAAELKPAVGASGDMRKTAHLISPRISYDTTVGSGRDSAMGYRTSINKIGMEKPSIQCRLDGGERTLYTTYCTDECNVHGNRYVK